MMLPRASRLLLLALAIAISERVNASSPEPEMPLPKLRVTEGPPAAPRQPGKDYYGDPLPAGAIARIGSIRMRHKDGANTVAFSPDGKLLASGGADKAVRVWSTADGEQKHCLRGHDTPIRRVVFSADGKFLAASGEQGDIALWDVRTGRQVERFDTIVIPLTDLAFSPDNHFLAAAGNGQGFLWDLTTGRLQQHSRGGNGNATSAVGFAVQGKSLLFGCDDVLFSRDLLIGKEQRQLTVPAARILALQSLQDGRTLAAGVDAHGRGIRAIDAGNGRVIRRFDAEMPPICSAAIDAQGRLLASGGDQHSAICLHDLTTGKTRWLRGHDQQDARINAVAFSADSKLLASADREGIVQLWDVERGEERLLRNRPLSGLYGRLSPDGRIVATLETGDFIHPRSVCLWESASGRLLRRLDIEDSRFQEVAFSSDSKSLAVAVGIGECTVLLLNTATGKLVCHCRGKLKGIAFLAFSPNGQRLLGGNSDRLYLWDTATGKQVPGFSASDSQMGNGVFSADGTKLAATSYDGTLHILDAASGRELRRLIAHGGFAVPEVAFSPDGQMLATIGADDFVSLWDTRTYARLRRLPIEIDRRPCVAFSADSRLIAAGSATDGFRVGDAQSGRLRHQVSGHTGAVISLSFAADGKTLASGSRDGTVLIWNVKSLPPLEPPTSRAIGRTDRLGDPLPPGAVARLGSIRFHHESQYEGSIVTTAFAPDGKTLATGSAGNSGTSVRLWDVASGRQLRLLTDYPAGIEQVAFSPDGKLLAGLAGGTLTVWDAASGERRVRLKVHENDASCFAFAPDGKVVATADKPHHNLDNKYLVRLWNVAEGREVGHFAGYFGNVSALAFSADGKQLISYGPQVLIWDLKSGRLLHEFPLMGSKARFSPDGRQLAVPIGNTVRLWDVATQKKLRSFAASDTDAPFCFAPDGKSLAVDCDEGIRLYRIATGELLRRIPIPPARQSPFLRPKDRCAVFSPDGKTLLTIDGTVVRLWDVGTGRMVRPFGGHRGSISCLRFAPDGQTLVSGGADGTVRLWEARTGREILSFEKHGKPIAVVAFSPDGRTIASADDAGTIFLWRTATGEPCHRLRGLPGKIKALYFTADGRRLRANSAGGVCVWDTVSGKVVKNWHGENAKNSLSPVALSPDGRWLIAVRTKEAENQGGHDTAFLDYRNPYTGRILRSVPCAQGLYDPLMFTPDSQYLAARGFFSDIRFWEVATGAEIFNMQTLATPFAFSPDGRVVACPYARERNSEEGVECWDMATRRQLGRVAGHRGGVTALAFSPDGRLLATGSADETILIWDAHSLIRHRPPIYPPQPRRLEELWADLGGADSAAAHNALWSLVQRPAETLPFLRARLRPIPPPDERIKRWIADLDSDRFEVRRRAAEELERLGVLAESGLRAALGNQPTVEVRRTIEPLLEAIDKEWWSGERLRTLRAIAVLERIGSLEARRLLDKLAHGADAADITQHARAAVQRLDRP